MLLEFLEWILNFFLIEIPSHLSNKQREKYGPPDERRQMKRTGNVLFYIEAALVFSVLALIFIGLPILIAVHFV